MWRKLAAQKRKAKIKRKSQPRGNKDNQGNFGQTVALSSIFKEIHELIRSIFK